MKVFGIERMRKEERKEESEKEGRSWCTMNVGRRKKGKMNRRKKRMKKLVKEGRERIK